MKRRDGPLFEFSQDISSIVSISIGALVYFILIYIFKIDEVDWIIKVVRDKLDKVAAKA